MQNILCAVQKISVKRRAQDMMIGSGIIEWICRVLRNATRMQEYTLEYVTALLTNLALRTEGRKRCEDPRLEVLNVLKPLIQRDNPQIKTYINGTLYSLFTSRTLKEEARKSGFPDLLQKMIRSQNEEIGNQLRFMLGQLQASDEEQPDYGSDEEEKPGDETEDDISYCPEDEEEDKEMSGKGIQTGEELLLGEFLASTEDALQQSRIISQQMASRKVSPTNLGADRPVTPVSGAAKNPMPPVDIRVPSAMRARPKIPRTPIPVERLEQVRKENTEILHNAVHVGNPNPAKKQIRQGTQQPQRRKGSADQANMVWPI